MFFGQVLMASGDQDTYFTPWFPRGGNKALIVVDLINKSSNGSATVVAQTKKSNQSDKDATGLNSLVVNTIGQSDFYAGAGLDDTTNPGFENMVRFQVVVGEDSGDWVHLRILNPSWLAN